VTAFGLQIAQCQEAVEEGRSTAPPSVRSVVTIYGEPARFSALEPIHGPSRRLRHFANPEMRRAERAMVPLQLKYSKAIELAEQADIDSAPEEHEGRLYFIGTVRAPADVSKIWEAIRALPEWEAEVIADIRSADFGAAIMTFAPPARPELARAAKDPFSVRPAG
jgi:hypothetical protein